MVWLPSNCPIPCVLNSAGECDQEMPKTPQVPYGVYLRRSDDPDGMPH